MYRKPASMMIRVWILVACIVSVAACSLHERLEINYDNSGTDGGADLPTPDAGRDGSDPADMPVDTPEDIGADAADMPSDATDMPRDVADMADAGDMADMEVCEPESDGELCVAAGYNCGRPPLTDSCGNPRMPNCGTCATPDSCGGSGSPNVCGCSPENDTDFCARNVKNCGMFSGDDACGRPRTANCGTCMAPATCGGGGTANVCACGTETDAAFCARLGATCGSLTGTDLCGQQRTVDCGGCPTNQVCGGGGTANQCGCTPENDATFCSRNNAECGSFTANDNCGQSRTVTCGPCPFASDSCVSNTCMACTPESNGAFCSRLSVECGSFTANDNCNQSRTANCGGCTAPNSCSSNMCVCNPESDSAFCSRNGANCGSLSANDNCNQSRTVNCGACSGDCNNNVCRMDAWWDTQWNRRRKITFNNTGQNEDLMNFPVLIALNSSRIDYASAGGTGTGLRFVDDDGTTEIDYDIDVWDPAGTSYIWVNVPQIDAQSNSDHIWMYWETTFPGGGEQEAATWGDYAAVWHLEDLVDVASPSANATDAGSTTTSGRIAAGRAFSGGSNVDYGSPAKLQLVADTTFSMWFNYSALAAGSGNNTLVAMGANGENKNSNYLYRIAINDDRSFNVFWEQGAGTDETFDSATSGIGSGQWHLLTVVHDATAAVLRFYIDGAIVGSAVPAANPATDGGNGSFVFGADPVTPGSLYLEGALDEVRIAPIARSTRWVRAQHLSQTDAFASYGSQELQ